MTPPTSSSTATSGRPTRRVRLPPPPRGPPPPAGAAPAPAAAAAPAAGRAPRDRPGDVLVGRDVVGPAGVEPVAVVVAGIGVLVADRAAGGGAAVRRARRAGPLRPVHPRDGPGRRVTDRVPAEDVPAGVATGA